MANKNDKSTTSIRNVNNFELNPSQLDSLSAKICDRILPIVETKLNAMLASINTQLATISTRLNTVEQNIDLCRSKIQQHDSSVASIDQRVLQIERFNRQDDLIIHGLQYNTTAEAASVEDSEVTFKTDSNKSTEDVIIQFAKHSLNLDVRRTDISVAYRTKKTQRPRSGANANAPAPILVRFSNKRVRQQLLQKRKELKDTGFFINENLTKQDSEIFFGARQLYQKKKIFSCWAFNGQVFLKKSATSNPVKVENVSQLSGFA